MQIGGPGQVVEIDETSVKTKSKFGKGKRYEDCWLFGGVGRATKRFFGVITFMKQNKAVLLPILKMHVRAGSIVSVSEVKTATGEKHTHSLETELLKEMQYTTVGSATTSFVDPATGVHKNEIDGFWEIRIKCFIKAMRELSKEQLHTYPDEFLWRSWYFGANASKRDVFEEFMSACKNYHPA